VWTPCTALRSELDAGMLISPAAPTLAREVNRPIQELADDEVANEVAAHLVTAA